MTTREIDVELRLGDERGAVLWHMPREVRVERFIGWFGAAECGALLRNALDALVLDAAAGFDTPAFVDAVAASRRRGH